MQTFMTSAICAAASDAGAQIFMHTWSRLQP
jgi:hypothetical protein